MSMNNTSANPDGPEQGRSHLPEADEKGETSLERDFEEAEFGEGRPGDDDPDPVANLE
ncbi:hypothetical protein [Leucobacter sp. USHLN153]|uniref:hypothetical protein n=1 Tax=Leucobacter sp. USHLN153 TaxID=3081268 RepID=UPI003017AFF3